MAIVWWKMAMLACCILSVVALAALDKAIERGKL